MACILNCSPRKTNFGNASSTFNIAVGDDSSERVYSWDNIRTLSFQTLRKGIGTQALLELPPHPLSPEQSVAVAIRHLAKEHGRQGEKWLSIAKKPA